MTDNVPQQSSNPTKAKKIAADFTLQKRVGNGPLNQEIVKRAERVMSSHEIDFTPLASEYLKELSDAVEKCERAEFNSKEEAVAAITAPVMQLKANSKTFGYDLIGDMASIMLGFVETIQEVDKTVIEIVSAHHRTLHAIIMRKVKGDGGAYGTKIQAELKGACQRYIAKMRAKA